MALGHLQVFKNRYEIYTNYKRSILLPQSMSFFDNRFRRFYFLNVTTKRNTGETKRVTSVTSSPNPIIKNSRAVLAQVSILA